MRTGRRERRDGWMSGTMADTYVPYSAPVPPTLFPALAFVLMIVGVACSAWFFSMQTISTKLSRNAGRDLAISAAASLCLGLGLVFTLLSNGIWI
ncbi:Transmembrane protein [Porphyridium purpureum]|uniref:Dolichyl-diphosphooligosaccharide-protein glycosyltransferase subunit OST5 n=1 Tax=Porphyridium purpureum TaxID=35688 RepID=A0A5J4YSV2_PORPP|nr:Transmembrane protein [Porphyridium purpureum]|eukprot:POR2250..scf227_4